MFREKLLFRARQVAGWLGWEIHRKRASRGVGYGRVYPAATYSPWAVDQAFLSAYDRIKAYTMVDQYRCWELWQFAKQTGDGAIVEIGVRKGGSGCLLAQAAPRSRVYLCDTFTGIPTPSDRDPSFRGGEYSDTSAEGVRALASSLNLTNVTVLAGYFPQDSAHKIPEATVAMCHIDVDIYESAKQTLAWVAPRLSETGVVVFDDYGFGGASGVTDLVNQVRKDWLFVHNLNGHAILFPRPGTSRRATDAS